ncbi:SCO2522 family protein [Nocardia alni]|uniref:SCO2522 family protein n=1 Tax=Nocardia alni TaxID=2815723 RepID=UPI001C23AEA8|nr:SCO2522 family protein [Nocardia alni]
MLEGYSEATERPRITPVPLSHLSIEVGHFTLKAIAEDLDMVRGEFRRIVPLVAAFTESARIQFGPDARISTCYLIDDYFMADTVPAKILPRLLGAAKDAGLVIDYLARESACAQTSIFVDGVPLGEPIPVAEMVAARIVPEPALQDTGGRPPTAESGWLCNGRRSSLSAPTQAMRPRTYLPPKAFSAREHSIFIDVELWSKYEIDGVPSTRWSCPFLAAIWHLLRLGMLRHDGEAVVAPQLGVPDEPDGVGDAPDGVREPDSRWPDRWADVPPVVQLNRDAQPFAAYQTLSMLPKRYMEIEHAVRVILDHLDLDEDVTAQIVAAGAAEAVAVSPTVSERQSHLLLDGS